jgi:hypothetical protein
MKSSRRKKSYDLIRSSESNLNKAIGVSRKVKNSIEKGKSLNRSSDNILNEFDDLQEDIKSRLSPSKKQVMTINDNQMTSSVVINSNSQFTLLDPSLYKSAVMQSLLGLGDKNGDEIIIESTINTMNAIENVRKSKQIIQEQPPQTVQNFLSKSFDMKIEKDNSALLLYNAQFSGLEVNLLFKFLLCILNFDRTVFFVYILYL